jgi:RHS repeat-associated protein
VRSHSAYDPYGASNDAGSGIAVGERDPETELGYQSESADAITGNILVGPRQYDPTTQRFTTADVFIDAGADLSLATDPLTGNRYLFAAANPVALDDDGHEPCVSDCNRMYSGTEAQQRRRDPSSIKERDDSAAAEESFYLEYVRPLSTEERVEQFTTGLLRSPTGFPYEREVRLYPGLGVRALDTVGDGCSAPLGAPKTPIACQAHDYLYDLIRAGAFGYEPEARDEARGIIDTQFRSDVLGECNAMNLGSLTCTVRAAGAHAGVSRLGGGVINESIRDIDTG